MAECRAALIGGVFMEGKFIKIAQEILRGAADGGLRQDQIPAIVGREAEGKINCYPGDAVHKCFPTAVFVALEGKLKSGRWHYNFERSLQAMVKHVHGACPHVTRDVVLITDSWCAPIFEKWQANINTMIQSGINVEIYIILYPNIINQLGILSSTTMFD
jgi:hypothetical protein